MSLLCQLKLRSARVLIVGCGGLGCPAAIYLAAAGVGTIGLLDDDTVELNNLHRQVAHSEAAVGKSKVSSLADRCTQLNSTVTVEQHVTHLTSSNAVQVIQKYDLVLDCSDNLATRYLINDACAVSGPKPLISGSALRLEGQMTVYLANRMLTKEEADSDTRLPSSARAPCFRCLYPVPPAADTVQGCSEAGVLGVVPGIIGTMQAAEAIKLITGIGTVHSGRLFVLDMERNLTRTVTLRNPRTDCKACGDEATLNPETIPSMDYVEFCGAPDHDRVFFREISEQGQWLFGDFILRTFSFLYRLSFLYILPPLDLSIFLAPPPPPDSVVLVCHRGNKSRIAALQLASALCSFHQRHSRPDLTVELSSDAAGDQVPDFVVCDVAGGLAAWASEIDPHFPVY
ncbi:unnamed protein product [Echinostoma caproni]|uniref:ThiF domain-containing protein n=1 Tax=Echinostoma caproni TaxID=27848 RepID=A0A183AHE3_9TREM|nr:unnamed protein product [Echinostoma caproni]